mmetsp:Transcript_3218/g.12705  ORF Transcript_3218/g.12705 Transcript_3218/m.12705 type:complete len:414 (+) Transcript_3218:1630-2871(+)
MLHVVYKRTHRQPRVARHLRTHALVPAPARLPHDPQARVPLQHPHHRVAHRVVQRLAPHAPAEDDEHPVARRDGRRLGATLAVKHPRQRPSGVASLGPSKRRADGVTPDHAGAAAGRGAAGGAEGAVVRERLHSERRRGSRECDAHERRHLGEDPVRHSRIGVLFLNDQRYPAELRGEARREGDVPAGAHDDVRGEFDDERDRPRDRVGELEGHEDVPPRERWSSERDGGDAVERVPRRGDVRRLLVVIGSREVDAGGGGGREGALVGHAPERVGDGDGWEDVTAGAPRGEQHAQRGRRLLGEVHRREVRVRGIGRGERVERGRAGRDAAGAEIHRASARRAREASRAEVPKNGRLPRCARAVGARRERRVPVGSRARDRRCARRRRRRRRRRRPPDRHLALPFRGIGLGVRC